MVAVIIVIVVVVLAALVGGGIVLAKRRRTQQLQQQFGPEYDKVLQNSDNKGEAESELASRKKRHDSLELKQLDPETKERYRSDWKRIQGSFVDDPGGAVEHADSLVTSIMRERGYPLDDFEQRANDISVEHPRVVEHYREARRVHDAHRSGTAGTEDLRGAVTSYRNLVEALLDDGGSDGGSDGARDHAGDRGAGDRHHDRADGHGADGDGDGSAPTTTSDAGSGAPRDGGRA